MIRLFLTRITLFKKKREKMAVGKDAADFFASLAENSSTKAGTKKVQIFFEVPMLLIARGRL